MKIEQQQNQPDLSDDAALSACKLPGHAGKDQRPSDEAELSAYDKEIADSFPASDPPTQP